MSWDRLVNHVPGPHTSRSHAVVRNLCTPSKASGWRRARREAPSSGGASFVPATSADRRQAYRSTPLRRSIALIALRANAVPGAATRGPPPATGDLGQLPPVTVEDVRRELRGRDLAWYC